MNYRKLMLNLAIFSGLVILTSSKGFNATIWQIGQDDGKCNEFALAPDGYKGFLEKEFGWEDRYFLIGKSTALNDWPYIFPAR